MWLCCPVGSAVFQVGLDPWLLSVAAPPACADQSRARVAGGADGAVQGAWWASFESDQLDALIAEALLNNRDLRAAAARVEAAAAQVRIAGADLTPSVDATVNGQRDKRNFVGLPIPGGGDVLTTHASTYNLTFISNWELDLWGRIRLGKRTARQDFEALCSS